MASSLPYYRALPNRHVGKGDRLGWQKKKEKGWEGGVKSNVTGRSGAYGRCNTGQLYALVRTETRRVRVRPRSWTVAVAHTAAVVAEAG